MEPIQNNRSENYSPASLAKRIIAFGMDSILLYILIRLIGLITPSLYNENSQKEFDRLMHQLAILESEEQFESKKWETFSQNSKVSPETFQMILIIVFTFFILPIVYFFCGESFFQGRTLGKATFGLQTKMLNNFDAAPKSKILIRSTIKGLATITLVTPFDLLGILNFCFCIFCGRFAGTI